MEMAESVANDDVSSPFSFSQFSARCRKEWVSIKSSDGGEPVFLCGSQLPKPMEFPGGNITVTHHFLPHLFPVSSFLLSYARGIVLFRCGAAGSQISLFYGVVCSPRLRRMPGNILRVSRGPLPPSVVALQRPGGVSG